MFLGEFFHDHSSPSFIDVPTNPSPPLLLCPARALVPLHTSLAHFLSTGLAYQRSLVNTYCTSDLCRPMARKGSHRRHNVHTAIQHRFSARPRPRACQGDHQRDHRCVLVLTRSGAGANLPGLHREMSGDESGRARSPRRTSPRRRRDPSDLELKIDTVDSPTLCTTISAPF
jgi:hypothetical protein